MSCKTLCRICPSVANAVLDFVDIFKKCSPCGSVAEMLLELAGIKVAVDDGLPQFCCNKCLSDLINAITTKRKCIAAEVRFRANYEPCYSEYSQSKPQKLKASCPVYRCWECNLDFFDSETLKNHYESHHAGTSNAIENEANKATLYDTSSDEDIDETTTFVALQNAEQQQWIRCCGCLMLFATEAELNEHSKAIHKMEATSTDKARAHQCDICYRSFTTAKGVTDHKTARKEMRYQCAICGIRYSKLQNLNAHEMKHKNDMIPCDICGETFTYRSSLNKHMRNVHDCQELVSPSQHVCNECGKSFSSATYLKDHLKLHANEAPYACELCEARFKLKVYLKWHMARHYGKFRCKHCNVAFKNFSELRAHQHRHSGRKAFDCNVCAKNFYTEKDMSKHKREVHKIFKTR